MIAFMKDMLRMPKPWVAWLGLLMAVNMFMPLFFLDTLEARIVLAAIIASAILMTALHARFGFVRLLGLGHIFWVPLLPWLYLRLCGIGAGSPLSVWLWSVMILNGISLLLDGADVFRYWRGEREPTTANA